MSRTYRKKSKKNTYRKISNASTKYETIWGKNKPLEKFWMDLAEGKKMIAIYTFEYLSSHKNIKM